MGLREREAAYWRKRLWPAWDRTGGPTRFGVWLYERPWAVHLGLGVVAAALIGLGLTVGDGIADAPWRALVLLAIVAWFHRLQARLYREWLEQRDPSTGPPEPIEGGWWERAAAQQQARAEVENENVDEDLTSPVFNRLFGLYVAYLGVGLVAVILVAALT